MKTKTYTIVMFPVYGMCRYWHCQAKSLAEAAFRFRGTGDRNWMSAFVSVTGSQVRHNIDGFSRIGKSEWMSPTVALDRV